VIDRNVLAKQIIKNFITPLPLTTWLFILTLAGVPILVGIAAIMLTSWPEIDPLLGNLVPPPNPWPTVMGRSAGFALILGIGGWGMAFVPANPRFQRLPILIKTAVLAFLILLLVGLFWVAIIELWLTVLSAAHHGPMIGWPGLPKWVAVVGWIWTGGAICLALFP